MSNTTTAKTMTQGWAQFHVWSKQWPSPNRRYEGIVWAEDAYAAEHAARKQFGNSGKSYDIQDKKFGQILRKSA